MRRKPLHTRLKIAMRTVYSWTERCTPFVSMLQPACPHSLLRCFREAQRHELLRKAKSSATRPQHGTTIASRIWYSRIRLPRSACCSPRPSEGEAHGGRPTVPGGGVTSISLIVPHSAT